MEFQRGKKGMSWLFMACSLELTSFYYPLVSKISRSSPKPLPRIYIKKENIEQEEEESFIDL
jgi:hypothetical protein